MTKQIVIKLNEKKFKPIFEKLESNGYGSVKSHSEFVGKILFFEYLLWNQKCKELGNKTRMELILEKLKLTDIEFMQYFLLKYTNFFSERKKNDLSKISECS